MNKNILDNEKPTTKQSLFSWKSFIVAFVLAALLNQLISGINGVEPRKNIAWTAAWIYLSIEAWKLWTWKALLPYPLFLIVSIIFKAIFLSTGEGKLSWTYISIAIILNIGGLIVFYLFLINTQHANRFTGDKLAREKVNDNISVIQKTLLDSKKSQKLETYSNNKGPLSQNKNTAMRQEIDKSKYFEQALTEIETNNLLKSTWAMAYSDADGDENKAKARYLRMRAEQLNQEYQNAEALAQEELKTAHMETSKGKEEMNIPKLGIVISSEAYELAGQLIGQFRKYKNFDYGTSKSLIMKLNSQMLANDSFLFFSNSIKVMICNEEKEFENRYDFSKWATIDLAPRVIAEYEESITATS